MVRVDDPAVRDGWICARGTRSPGPPAHAMAAIRRNITAPPSRRPRARSLLASLACLALCAGVAQTQPPVTIHLWDGFEEREGWSVDAANDPATITWSARHVSEGALSLKVDGAFKDTGRVMVRRAAKLRVSGMTQVLVDVYSASDQLGFAFACKDERGAWHESRAVALRAGWNRDVRAPISALGLSSGRSYYREPDEISEFFLILQHAGPEDEREAHRAIAYLDNLRFEGEPEEGWNRTAPRSVEVFQPARGVGLYEKFQVGVQFVGVLGNVFDPDDVLVEAIFTAPDGSRRTIRGFMAGYADHERLGAAWPMFLLRFAPTQVGRWEFVVRVANTEGQTTGRRRWFYVKESANPGFVRVSRKDPIYFETDTDKFFYPIGQNVAWARDYETYFKRQQASRQNWVRIWLCPWNVQLEKKPGHYDLDEAARLDAIVEGAEAAGLRIQLVLFYHGMVTDESWDKNPYNSANGGPCYVRNRFFTSQEARDLLKRRLDYILARWGYSTAIFAWELFNEVDICDYQNFDDVVDWHREMSEYLKGNDPNRHLVTTSVHKDPAESPLWELPNIDFVQSHVYDGDAARRVPAEALAMRKFRKPFFIAEYGHSGAPADAVKDKEGRSLRHALWSAFMLPVAGSAMPWWWDSHILPNNLERVFLPVAQLAEGMDRRGENYRRIDTAILLPGGEQAAVQGLLTYHSCYLWLSRMPNGKPAAPTSAGLLPRGQSVALSSMLGGKYDLTIMDAVAGTLLHSGELACQEGRLIVPLVRAENEIVVKIVSRADPDPSFFTSPGLLDAESKLGGPER